MTTKEFPTIPVEDKYRRALKITEAWEAQLFFEALVEDTMSEGYTREAAERIERGNLGRFAGTCDNEVRLMIEKLFACEHPIFGSSAACCSLTPDQALLAGLHFSQGLRASESPTGGLHICEQCGKREPWGAGWRWFPGILSEREPPFFRGLVMPSRFCSAPCADAFLCRHLVYSEPTGI